MTGIAVRRMTELDIPAFRFAGRHEALRQDVRAFLDREIGGRTAMERAESWMGFDRAFSRKMGARGWIGMTWPKRYGGHERSALERYVVLEELLAAGAPVSAHWMADRQSGPTLLRFGAEAQRMRVLPAIVRGELCFCAGLSEPDVGSDLAAVRTSAIETPEGWRVNGRKIWISNGHRADYMIALLRTDRDSESRHKGLSQFLIDLRRPQGVSIRGIDDIRGRHEFNEVTFDDALLPPDALIGERGAGWQQVTAELVLERSGPERYLSSMELLKVMLDTADESDRQHVAELGMMVVELATLRQMSVGVASLLEAGENPALQATVVKYLGAEFEQRAPELAHKLFAPNPGVAEGLLEAMMTQAVQVSPAFSLRGGTREILLGIIARGLGLR